MSIDPWDGLPNGQYVKWENAGDSITGDIVGKGTGPDINGEQVPQLTIRLDDGTEQTVTASQAQLRAKLLEGRPAVGDRIKIVYVKAEKRDGGKTLKHFEVTIKKGGAKVQPVSEAAIAAASEEF